MKLRDTAREKGEDLYDKTKQLFGVLLGHAKQEGPEMMKKVGYTLKLKLLNES